MVADSSSYQGINLSNAFFPNLPVATTATIKKNPTAIKNYCAANHMVYLDYYTAMAGPDGGMKPGISKDGVHPNAAGYAISPIESHGGSHIDLVRDMLAAGVLASGADLSLWLDADQSWNARDARAAKRLMSRTL